MDEANFALSNVLGNPTSLGILHVEKPGNLLGKLIDKYWLFPLSIEEREDEKIMKVSGEWQI